MKRIATRSANVALMFAFGAASVYAQHVPLALSFSGTEVNSPINLGPGVFASDNTFIGSGTLGSFTFHAIEGSAVPPGNCPATNHPYAGGGVFRFEDGSLLMVNLIQGSDCLQFTPTGPVAHCTRTYQVIGGTGRLKNASGGTIGLTGTVLAVLFDATNNPALFATTGNMTGIISGVAIAAEPQGAGQ